MSKVTLKILNAKDIMKDAKSLAQSLSQTIAKKSEKAIVGGYKNILNFYYQDYQPKSYTRTNQLRLDSYSPTFLSTKGGMVCHGGIVITPNEMHHEDLGSEYGYSEKMIIENFYDGWHGHISRPYIPKIEIEIMVEGICDSIIKGRDRLAVLSEAENNAHCQILHIK